MFEKLKELFTAGKLSEAGLNKAVSKGWITEYEAEAISNGVEGELNLEEHDGQT